MPIGNGFKGRCKGLGLVHLAMISVGPFKRALGGPNKNKGLIIITETGFIELVFRLNQSTQNTPAIIRLIKDVPDIR